MGSEKGGNKDNEKESEDHSTAGPACAAGKSAQAY